MEEKIRLFVFQWLDSNIISVTPDYKIEVREDILHETDGPMLWHGIQEL